MTSPYFRPTAHAPAPADSLPLDETLPVLVVGAGPVGMAVALGLARRGIATTVIEASDRVSVGSRAICVSRHSLEVAERLGLDDALRRRALPWTGGRSFHRDVEVMRFAMPNEPHAPHPPMVNLSQSEFEQMMVDQIAGEPLVTLLWGVTATSCTQSDGVVTLGVETTDGPRELRSSWVVAADGGRSRMRDLLGLRMEGKSYTGSYVIADIHWESALPAERRVWFDAPSNPGSTIIMHQQPDDIWRIDYQLDPADDGEAEASEERIRERITQHLDWLGHGSEPWALEWHGFYRAHALALDRFVHGRVIFGGDAAHLVPIFGVRGLNSGMEDAETLVWQLAAVIHGADPAMLDAYSSERHDAWSQNIANAGKSTLIMAPGSDGYRATRDALLHLAHRSPRFGTLVDPRQSSATHARRSPLTISGPVAQAGIRPGDPIADLQVELPGGSTTTLNHACGTGFTVLGRGLGDAAMADTVRLRDALAEVLPQEQVVLLLIEQEDPAADLTLLDTDGRLAAGLDLADGQVCVLRPDQLLLARDEPGRLAGLPEHLVSGGIPRDAAVDATVEIASDLQRREQTWMRLSEALDGAESHEWASLLTRVALLVGEQIDQDAFTDALAEAVAAG